MESFACQVNRLRRSSHPTGLHPVARAFAALHAPVGVATLDAARGVDVVATGNATDARQAQSEDVVRLVRAISKDVMAATTKQRRLYLYAAGLTDAEVEKDLTELGTE